MPSPGCRFLEAPASPRPPAALADDLLEEILLRVAGPADLARASTACASFRRLVTDADFLRRYRSLNPPLLLGFFDTVSSGFQPAEAPHPNATAARSIARAAAGFSPSTTSLPAGGIGTRGTPATCAMAAYSSRAAI
ncbi:unnamed protein product [Urochloa humidicola]